jgi:chromosomal replication initiation ATPase DnaA
MGQKRVIPMSDPRPRQLALDLPVEPRHGIEDFLVGGSNEAAYGLVEGWPDWAGPTVMLIGPQGSGKTHLAAIWAARAHAWVVRSADVTPDRVPHLGSNGTLVIEDCDAAPRQEAALFHLINAISGRKGHILLTARRAPDHWDLATPDLLSRLRLATTVEIGPPDDALLRAVLVKHFIDRQLVVDTSVVESLLTRMERSFAAASATVEQLDRLALERGRRVTRAMVSELLA